MSNEARQSSNSSPKNVPIRRVFVPTLLVVACLMFFVMLAARQATGQSYGQRTVAGAVVNDAGGVQHGATVFLKNLKTKAIRSYTTTEDGKFRFAQVSMSEDHEVWAEYNGKKSPVKTVSSWDTRVLFEVELKLK